jgi:hypothetical protein
MNEYQRISFVLFRCRSAAIGKVSFVDNAREVLAVEASEGLELLTQLLLQHLIVFGAQTMLLQLERALHQLAHLAHRQRQFGADRIRIAGGQLSTKLTRQLVLQAFCERNESTEKQKKKKKKTKKILKFLSTTENDVPTERRAPEARNGVLARNVGATGVVGALWSLSSSSTGPWKRDRFATACGGGVSKCKLLLLLLTIGAVDAVLASTSSVTMSVAVT